MKYIPTRIRNFADFMWFGVRTGNIGLFALSVDLLVPVYTLANFESIISTDNLLILFLLIFINVIWQVYSTVGACCDYYRRVRCFNTSVGVSDPASAS